MCHSNCGGCGGGMCTTSLIGKILLIVGGINWGLVGVGMLMGKDIQAWNVVHMILRTMPTIEAIVYVLVGIAAVMKIFGCRCKKCTAGCASCDAHGATDTEKKM